MVVTSISGNLIWTELMVKEKNASKTIISQILKPQMQIRKQKVTESKRLRPKRRTDKKTTQHFWKSNLDRIDQW
jgi:hypothetical protein